MYIRYYTKHACADVMCLRARVQGLCVCLVIHVSVDVVEGVSVGVFVSLCVHACVVCCMLICGCCFCACA